MGGGTIGELAAMLRAARRAVLFTGAGISTESGIPDFRSPGGIWSRLRPIDFRDFMASEAMRRESWRRKFEGEGVMAKAEPNRGHRAIAALIERGHAAICITQNVDNLHQASGIPADRIIELHGNATYARCLACGARHELAPIREAFLARGELPQCSVCGGIVKTATISFGQAMPEAELARARAATLACDLFLCVGSSLVVYPAASLPLLAREVGARLAIVNREPTEQDGFADLVIHGEMGAVLSEAVGLA